MSELLDFEIFMVTARTSSFTEAAGELRLSVATVSRAILRLENAIDCRLFNRTTRRLSLTHEGKLALDEITAGMHHLRNVRVMLQERRQKPTGTVKVLLPNGFAKHYLMPQLPAFFDRYPDIDLDLAIEDFGDDLLEGGFDVVVQHGPIPENGYIVRSLGTMRIILVASPGYLEKHGAPRVASDLAEHMCLQSRQRRNGPKFVWHLRDHATGQVCQHEPCGRIFIGSQLDVCINAALAGIGISPTDVRTVERHLAEGVLRTVLPDHELLGGELFMLYPHRDHVPLSVRAFMDFVAEGAAGWMRMDDFDASAFA